MRTFPEFKNKKIVVMGLGLHGGGVGAVKFFARQGAKVLVTDLKPKEALLPSIHALRRYRVKYLLGRHRKSDFRDADYIFKGPDVRSSSPYLSYARRLGIPILERVGFFLAHCPAFVIGITGSKGKSTTAELLANLLRRKYKRVWLLGIPGTSILEALPKIKTGDVVIAEFSSFELDDLHQAKLSPEIAIITAIFPDHLNRHRSFADYVRAKSAIFRYQGSDGILIIPRSAPWIRFLKKSEIPGSVIAVGSGRYRTLLRGDRTEKERQNFSLAFRVGELFGIPRAAMKTTLKRFRRLPGRREVIRRIGEITFVNDTTATNPESALSALRHYGRGKKLVAIVGGFDKKLDYRAFSRMLPRYAREIIFLPGTATEKMKKALPPSVRVRSREVSSIAEAVSLAFQSARKGDTVLLSPAAASFGLFQNEFDRGNQFVSLVKRLRL